MQTYSSPKDLLCFEIQGTGNKAKHCSLKTMSPLRERQLTKRRNEKNHYGQKTKMAL